ncbi:MAG: hypothetical protein GX621_15915 [Pirellulaceae bacterium]|nr:hypothetical protein [Pirellulaceae bacterium]
MLVYAITLGLMIGAAGSSAADRDAREEALADAPIIWGVPIDSGFLIFKGNYLPAPYVVGTRGDELFINDLPIKTEHLYMRGWGPGGFRSRWRYEPRDETRGPRSQDSGETPSKEAGETSGRGARETRRESSREEFERREPPRPLPNYTARVERQLENQALLIVFNDDRAVFVPNGFEVKTLEILLGGEPRDEKTQALRKLGFDTIESARWHELTGAFQPSAELAARVEKLKASRPVPARHPVPATELSKSLRYSITVIGIVLGVVALGSLLSSRPDSRAPWREIDTSGDSIPMVIRNVAFVIVLSFFDLACTLLARGSDGFVEINPLGSGLLEDPIMLAAFKVSSLLLGCGILLSLRRYRGAQIASWWLCLVCTILTFRWATYGSLFLV